MNHFHVLADSIDLGCCKLGEMCKMSIVSTWSTGLVQRGCTLSKINYPYPLFPYLQEGVFVRRVTISPGNELNFWLCGPCVFQLHTAVKAASVSLANVPVYHNVANRVGLCLKASVSFMSTTLLLSGSLVLLSDSHFWWIIEAWNAQGLLITESDGGFGLDSSYTCQFQQ